MNLSKKIGMNQKAELEETKAIVIELLKSIYWLDQTLLDVEKGEAKKEDIEEVHKHVKLLMDDFGVNVK